MGNGKIMGPILIVVGIVIFLLATAFVVLGYFSGRTDEITSVVLGISCFGIAPLALFGGVGTYLFISGRKEEAETELIRKKESILGLIQTQGHASVGSIMVEMEMTREEVTNAIYELVSMGLFSGFINWDKLEFYSKDAALIGSNTCPNCGGIRELVGKGVVKCPYCGVSLFVPEDAVQTQAKPKAPTDEKQPKIQ
ncbi:MAG: hypothetical protein QGM50_04885 [Anaerolineae bacterium]|nr:hypothetical protein [Anaerolineae bacterium]MDK1080034.1 hypothetical protein [Anaerolineae bacterium]MDK1118110.1 hypothetical protein [Anaerolineae bacterium]